MNNNVHLLVFAFPIIIFSLSFRYLILGIQKYAVFSGRASRKEWWGFQFAILSIPFCIAVISTEQAIQEDVILFISIACSLVLTLPYIAITVRRLHDINLSGWLILLGLVPVLGGLFILICTLIAGNKEKNSYGDPIESISKKAYKKPVACDDKLPEQVRTSSKHGFPLGFITTFIIYVALAASPLSYIVDANTTLKGIILWIGGLISWFIFGKLWTKAIDFFFCKNTINRIN